MAFKIQKIKIFDEMVVCHSLLLNQEMTSFRRGSRTFLRGGSEFKTICMRSFDLFSRSTKVLIFQAPSKLKNPNLKDAPP